MVLSTGAVTTIAGRDFGNVDGIDACEIQSRTESARAGLRGTAWRWCARRLTGKTPHCGSYGSPA